jgi:hypothetical protein
MNLLKPLFENALAGRVAIYSAIAFPQLTTCLTLDSLQSPSYLSQRYIRPFHKVINQGRIGGSFRRNLVGVLCVIHQCELQHKHPSGTSVLMPTVTVPYGQRHELPP